MVFENVLPIVEGMWIFSEANSMVATYQEDFDPSQPAPKTAAPPASSPKKDTAAPAPRTPTPDSPSDPTPVGQLAI